MKFPLKDKRNTLSKNLLIAQYYKFNKLFLKVQHSFWGIDDPVELSNKKRVHPTYSLDTLFFTL